ncbi:MAG: glycyl-tRNA synthetase [Edafosvirus sp.]|uniref:glycine--tRNA ligase n=1 Tax=Edafosvirus sp. TaxID=2487765 RepID=A0A3G4ZVD6_9VIRU|nr:MAG: glycyl-tRNA synthetase [Edafosvirus sp.]
MKQCLQENQIIIPSYLHYGGFSGFQDYGIVGFMIKQKFLKLWRNHFLFNEDNIEEIETPTIMSYDILKASGHIDKFDDLVVTDKTGKCYRADHLIKDHMKEQKLDPSIVDTMNKIEMEDYINTNKLTMDEHFQRNFERIKVEPRNLMFHAGEEYYLRPELAQGIFVNFDQLSSYMKNELPFGISQVGKSYRKEVSPQSFIRMREFTQAEIEYFFDPNNQNHKNFDTVKHLKIPILSSNMQIKGLPVDTSIDLETCVKNGLICNQILAYFLGRIYLFADQIGLDKTKIRFRQHLPQEMAHYAADCWDMECQISGSWIECMGCANRRSFDLESHKITKLKRNNIEYHSHVIEPSFGIDRLLLAIFDHNFKMRKDDNKRTVLSLPYKLCPYEVAIFQLSNKEELISILHQVKASLKNSGFKCYTDMTSTSIGKKYVRTDRIGIKYAITIDFDTLKDNTVTIRERDSTNQIRMQISDLKDFFTNK